MRCLIIGGDGMLGHQLLDSWRSRHDVRVTLHRRLSTYRGYRTFDEDNSFCEVDVLNLESVRRVLAEFQPEAVVNAVGVIKQRAAAKEVLPSLEINAAFPHRLRLLCEEVDARLVHVSTDCVFNGQRGRYTESDPCDARDVYGLSKYLGEVAESPAVTLRTSIIGTELSRKQSLIEWFLAQRGEIRGFTRAIYTGLTTIELARVIERVLVEHADLTGLWQVASAPISKYELLVRLVHLLEREDVKILQDEDFHCDRSLLGDAFAERTGYQTPSWEQMLAELASQIKMKESFHVAA